VGRTLWAPARIPEHERAERRVLGLPGTSGPCGRTDEQCGGAGGAAGRAVAKLQLWEPGSGRSSIRGADADGSGEPATAGTQRAGVTGGSDPGGADGRGSAVAGAGESRLTRGGERHVFYLVVPRSTRR
jgi:hypothetical protein